MKIFNRVYLFYHIKFLYLFLKKLHIKKCEKDRHREIRTRKNMTKIQNTKDNQKERVDLVQDFQASLRGFLILHHKTEKFLCNINLRIKNFPQLKF